MKKVSLAFVLSAVLFSPLSNANDNLDAIQLAVEHSSRSADNVQRDQYRHPAETLHFFELTPNSTVVEISPGGGWYTEILAPLLAAHGKLYAAHFPSNSTSEYYNTHRAAFVEKLAANPIYNRVVLTEFAVNNEQEIAPAGSADIVLTFRNLHNWYSQNGDAALLAAYKQFYTALKPGGVLGVVEHSLPAAQKDSDWVKSGYVPEELAIKLAEQAGFVLEAKSDINANPKDTADYEHGVWTLPPSFRLKQQDRAKYVAIGESNRMTLKFRKPVTQ
ncbi:class I SAM-dependent methyltransferase [Rheinheimera salexigens]|uniref:Methyltransferase n=1 Tax=Rheinheimera salexigens TaxID=1628148 RepID=A0A1E7Q3Z5_9GAMM|nr:class I SAM-dependent methyltransferase [Rheinheimera salexigens]OEY68840.1 methyltransferase [Rheinheimera salexigens]